MAQHGNKSALRWIFSSLAIELKQGDLQSCSLLLFTAANWLGTIFIVRRWVQNAQGLDQQKSQRKKYFGAEKVISKISC